MPPGAITTEISNEALDDDDMDDDETSTDDENTSNSIHIFDKSEFAGCGNRTLPFPFQVSGSQNVPLRVELDFSHSRSIERPCSCLPRGHRLRPK